MRKDNNLTYQLFKVYLKGSKYFTAISSIHQGYFYYCGSFPIKENILKIILREMGH
jgi:hypothetical protein